MLRINRLYIGCAALLLINTPIPGRDGNDIIVDQLKKQELGLSNKKKKKQNKKKVITVDFTNEPLTNIIQQWSEANNNNVVLPQGANAIKTTVNLTLSERLTLAEAWDLLFTLVDLAGYSLIPQNDLYIIVKNSSQITKQALPIYIATPVEELPDTEEQIRYLYYLANIKASSEPNSELMKVLKDILPQVATYKIDPATNSILISAKSNDIKGVMKIIKDLDKTGFHEKLDIIKLRYTNAQMIADLFNQSILKTGIPIHRYRLDAKKDSEVTFFSQHTRIIAADRTNSLLVLGQPQAVGRIRDFIYKYIDVELESGKSILHVYQLQYLDANTFAPILQKIVESTKAGGTGQAKAGQQIGIERVFENVIIRSDKPQSGSELNKYFGGNKLIIAARNADWKIIKSLIEKLDKPSPQVLIEILIADLTLEDVRQLGALVRNPEKIPFVADANAQSAQIGLVTTDANTDPTTIKSDLLRKQLTSSGSFPGTDESIAAALPAGSTVLSLNDSNGKTWGILQILKQFGHTKILSHPHVIATNNQQAEVSVGEFRLLEDEAVGSSGGTTQVKRKKVEANLQVTITPRISSSKSVNLQVRIDINQFTSTSNNTRIKRVVETNANVKSGDVLALGGLIRVDTINEESRTPILGRVPIIGNLFSKKNKRLNKTNLTVFISPTVIEPRLRGGVGIYTKDYIDVAKNYSQEGSLFHALKDPVTRWFFKTGNEDTDVVEKFMEKDEFKSFAPGPTNTNNLPKIEVAQNKDQQLEELKKLVELEENPLLQIK